MQSIMKKATLIAAAILLSASATARANTSDRLEVNVPFPFLVNGKSFPAGKYLVERGDVSPSVLLIRGEGQNHTAAFVSTTADGGHDPAGWHAALTFKRGEGEYRLATVWESDGEGWDVGR
jgi:hypothetical protein